MPKRSRIEASDFVLGFDFGMKRIGVAVGTKEALNATPLKPLSAQNGVPSWQLIEALVEKWDVKALVVGIPYTMDGSSQSTTHAARRFANKLSDRMQRPAFLSDERLTSVEARSQMSEHKLSFSVDSYSAKLILEQWFRSDEATWIRSN